MANLVTPEGITVCLGRHYAMVEKGREKGTWWRLDELFHDGTEHRVRASRKHPAGRVHRTFPPAIFGLVVREEYTRVRLIINRLHHVWQKIDEGVYMGALALIPLAFFEAYHGGEVTRQLLTYLFG
jgi:hypothetical protein